jgi:hypothetical protein
MVILAEPYKNFKEMVNITKQHLKEGHLVEVYPNFVYVEVWENGENESKRKS